MPPPHCSLIRFVACIAEDSHLEFPFVFPDSALLLSHAIYSSLSLPLTATGVLCSSSRKAAHSQQFSRSLAQSRESPSLSFQRVSTQSIF